MQLEKNLKRYQWAEARAFAAFDKSDYAQALTWANIAAYCAWNGHAGFYVAPQLEGLLHRVGTTLSRTGSPVPWSLPRRSGRHWLHVLTIAFEVGGHTPLAGNFITRLSHPEDVHSVLLIDQGLFTIPAALQQAVTAAGGEIFSLPKGLTLLERAAALKTIANAWAETVVLYTHPNDPVPCVAFGDGGGPPIVLYNHADHVFWLGSTIADLVIDLRPSGQDVTLQRRGVRRSEILPIPLRPRTLAAGSREESRRALGITAETRLLLSIGTSYKFEPYGEFDFPRLLAKTLQGVDHVKLLVIGPSADEACWQEAFDLSAGKVQAIGVQKDLSAYYQAADLYLESFPVGSLIASLDAVLYGVPVFRALHPPLPVLCLDRYDGMNANPADAGVYREMLLDALAAGGLEALGARQKVAVVDQHLGAGWDVSLQRLVAAIPAQHRPGGVTATIAAAESAGSDHLWAEMQSRHSFMSRESMVLKNALRRNYPYLKKAALFFGFLESNRLGELPRGLKSLREIFIDLALVLSPKCLVDVASKIYVKNLFKVNR